MNCPYVMKRCTKCGEVLHISRYHKDKNCKYKVRNICKECQKKIGKSYYNKNKKEILDKCKVYREEHKEEKRKQNKVYRENHKEYYKEYNKTYYKNNKDKIMERHDKWEKENQEHLQEYRKNYYLNNKHISFNSATKRRFQEENQGNGITQEQWYEMMEFFNWECAYSGEYLGGDNKDRRRTIDHIVPISKNGEHEVWNCVPMIKSYNSKKHDNNMLEWYLEQEYFDIDRLTKIYEWRIYAYWKWKEGTE